MHALAAHGYHLLLRILHLATLPVSRALAAALAVALAVQVSGARMATLGGAVAVLAGWAALAPPTSGWPPPPVERLTGLAVIVLGEAALRSSVRPPRLLSPATALLAAWWLRGAPAGGAALLDCLPVFLGLLASFAAARQLTQRVPGWTTLAAVVALAGSLGVTGASPHWAEAALVPAIAALALQGSPAPMPALAEMVVSVAAAALVASDRGRLVPIDVACLLPLLVWTLVPRLAERFARFGPVIAGVLAVLLCLSVAWAAARLLG